MSHHGPPYNRPKSGEFLPQYLLALVSLHILNHCNAVYGVFPYHRCSQCLWVRFSDRQGTYTYRQIYGMEP